MDLSEVVQIGTYLQSASYRDQGKLNCGASSESICSANKISKKKRGIFGTKNFFQQTRFPKKERYFWYKKLLLALFDRFLLGHILSLFKPSISSLRLYFFPSRMPGCHNLCSQLPSWMIFLPYTGTSALITYISNIQRTEK